ncbi:MAG: ATP synthase F1 subunit delta [Candidatus Omnitrophica bacterium]|nr:ATP synthase F1 subunit delta [Candidatus Omnitrophota bacterium]
MREDIVVERYSEAFVAFAKTNIGVEKAVQEVRVLRNTIMRENPEFLPFLESLQITDTEKCDFIDRVVRNGFSEQLRQFLKLLVEKERIGLLLDIAEYLRVNYLHGEERDALLKTSFPLNLDLIKTIEERIAKKFGGKFKFYISLDGDLLGGIQVVIGNKVIDGSVRRQLEELKEKLLAVRV